MAHTSDTAPGMNEPTDISDNEILTPAFDPHTLRVLEFGAIIAQLSERTACALGAERARDLTPSPVHSFVAERQTETREARTLIGAFGAIPLGGIYDVRPLLVRAEVGQSLAPGELLQIASTVLNSTRLKQFLTRNTEKSPLLAQRSQAISDFPVLLGEIENCIGRDGSVQDGASSVLATLRTQVRTLARKVDDRLNQYLSGNFRAMLQDPLIVLRDDRRCLPVKAEYKSAIKGIVHDQSSSGATLFIEPMPVVEMNNELRQVELKERAEVQRILARLTALVGKQGEKIHATCEVVAGIDLASAKARLANDMQATEPSFNNRGFVRIREGRHPLLDSDTVVPTTLTLGDKYKTLLITGPNTGGKTVTLKTVGLFTLMAQSGLQVPALQGTELAYFDQVFADIGDEQSIQQNLSTFSAHITNIVRILRQTGTRALVLMDEIGAGTDPGEGAALAKAILSYLLKHNARVIATTHYGELKEFAYMVDGIENAAVEFDPETLRPTYRLLQGVPGSSNAFHISRRLGMPRAVIEDATRNLSQADVDAGQVMQRLEKAKRIADDERRKAERLSRELDEMKLKYEARLRDLEVLRREAKERATREAQVLIARNTQKMENIIGELRRVGKEGRKTQSARKRMKETSEELIGGIGYENDAVVADAEDAPKRLKKGDKVRVLSLGSAQGEVIEDSDGKEALVQVGAIRVTVPMSALRPQSATAVDEGERRRAVAGKSTNAAAVAMEKATTISPEISLIGLRTDVGVPRFEKYLDDAFTAGLEYIRVVHGKGTGMMRKGVWEALKNDTRIAAYQLAHPDEGGAGVTMVRLAV